jgi:hypothetical protein
VTRIGAQPLADARARSIFGARAPRESSYLVVLELPVVARSADGGVFRDGMPITGSVTLGRPTLLELVFGRGS